MRKNSFIFYLAQRLAKWFIPVPKRRIYCKDTGEMVGTYTEYLRTRHWRLVKARYKLGHRYRCVECGSREKGLHLHHLTYANIGKEKDADLIYLCGECHVLEHKKWRTKKGVAH